MDYTYFKDYEVSDSWYEPECQPEDEKQAKLDAASHQLRLVIKHLYSKDPLDLSKLEENLDELCYLLDTEIGQGDLQITRKNSKTSLPVVKEWIVYNNNYMKQLAQG
jgi:hypothetical protein